MTKMTLMLTQQRLQYMVHMWRREKLKEREEKRARQQIKPARQLQLLQYVLVTQC